MSLTTDDSDRILIYACMITLARFDSHGGRYQQILYDLQILVPGLGVMVPRSGPYIYVTDILFTYLRLMDSNIFTQTNLRTGTYDNESYAPRES